MINIICLIALAIIEVWVINFMMRNNPGNHVRRHLGIAILFGLFSIAVAFILEEYGGSLFGGDATSLGSISTLPLVAFVAFMGVGFIEEFAKFFPFSRYLLSKNLMTSVTDTVTYFVVIGLVFGLVEDIIYAQSGGLTVFVRLASSLFFHAALASIVGFYFARSYFLRAPGRQTLVAYVSVAVIHGVFDYSTLFSDSLFFIAWGLSVFVNCYMLWLFYKAMLFDYQFRNGMIRPVGPMYPVAPPQLYAAPQMYAQPAPWQPAPQQPIAPQQPAWQPPQAPSASAQPQYQPMPQQPSAWQSPTPGYQAQAPVPQQSQYPQPPHNPYQ